MDINGKKVLLTGATGGLGRAIAEALAGRGAQVVVSGRKAEALETLVAGLPGSGHAVITADLAEPGEAERLAAEAGDVDILVANAGLPGTSRLPVFTSEEVQRTLRVNLEAPMLLARAFEPAMLAKGQGHMVFVASLAGKGPAPQSSVYNATKFGLRGFAFGLRCDLGPEGVGVSVVSPGFIRDAGMFADSGASAPAGIGTATPTEVADAVVKAITSDKVEIAVAPMRQRALAHFGLVSPSMAVRASSSKAGQKAAAEVTAGQGEKR